jgi:hypothetical protein
MIGNLLNKKKLPSLTTEIEQFPSGVYIIKQDGRFGIINILDASFNLTGIFGTGSSIDYRDFGTITIDSFNRMYIRRGNLILRYDFLK